MKALLIASLALLSPLAAHAREPSGEVKLLGIINLAGKKRAVLEHPRPFGSGAAYSILGPGEREENIGVTEILPEKNIVKVRLKNIDSETTLKLADLPIQISSAGNTVNLENVDLNTILRLYGEWCGQTFLRWPSLPNTTFSVRGYPDSQAEAAKLAEQALAAQDILTIPDGTRFLIVVPKNQSKLVAN